MADCAGESDAHQRAHIVSEHAAARQLADLGSRVLQMEVQQQAAAAEATASAALLESHMSTLAALLQRLVSPGALPDRMQHMEAQLQALTAERTPQEAQLTEDTDPAQCASAAQAARIAALTARNAAAEARNAVLAFQLEQPPPADHAAAPVGDAALRAEVQQLREQLRVSSREYAS